MNRWAAAGALLLVAGCASTATGAAPAGSVRTGAAPTGTGPGGDFCAMVRAKGGADLFQIDDTSTGDVRSILDNLDALAAAAPSDLKADLAVVDRVEHDMFDSGSPDPAAFAKFRDPAVVAALHHIATYLTDQCHIDLGA